MNESNQTDADRRRKRLISRWALSPYWSPEEGVALASGLDPNEAIVRQAGGYDRASIRASDDARHMLDLAYRAVGGGTLEEEAAPIAFMKWARSIGVEFHADWWAAVVNKEALAEDGAEATLPAPPVQELKTRERDSLLKLVVGMAVGGYSWDPQASRTEAIADIVSDLELAGIPLDADTVRKWLRKGAELLPGPDA